MENFVKLSIAVCSRKCKGRLFRLGRLRLFNQPAAQTVQRGAAGPADHIAKRDHHQAEKSIPQHASHPKIEHIGDAVLKAAEIKTITLKMIPRYFPTGCGLLR